MESSVDLTWHTVSGLCLHTSMRYFTIATWPPKAASSCFTESMWPVAAATWSFVPSASYLPTTLDLNFAPQDTYENAGQVEVNMWNLSTKAAVRSGVNVLLSKDSTVTVQVIRVLSSNFGASWIPVYGPRRSSQPHLSGQLVACGHASRWRPL
eukprot:TRINITY_DN5149_c1_g2_i1.p1 TRINITY_DN5149_c1_g2~~TRINITY_DN5149_c1_g2_i1.p1  ORF type:complete len:153 (-),score=21.35 TRINITY_DN5149_c1_g2_i1:68-526(-)